MKNIKINKKKSLKDRYDDETEVQALILNRTTKTKHIEDIDLSSYNNSEAYEILTTAVEHYMLKGITSPQRLAKTLGHTLQSVKGAIKRVELRWSVTPHNKKDMIRGKTLATYDKIMSEAYNILEKDNDSKNKLSALRLLSDVNTKISELTGIKAVEGVSTTNIAIVQGDQKRANIQLIQQKFNDLLNASPTLEHPDNTKLTPIKNISQAQSVVLDIPMVESIDSLPVSSDIDQEENAQSVNCYIGDSIEKIPESSTGVHFEKSEEEKKPRTRRRRPTKK